MFTRGGGSLVTKIFEPSFEADLQMVRIALQSILEYGWIQKSAGNPEQGFCAMGGFSNAIFEILGKPDKEKLHKQYNGSAYYHFMPATKKEINDYIAPFPSIPAWNDDPERVENDVLGFYEHMIDFLKNRVVTINTTYPEELRGLTSS